MRIAPEIGGDQRLIGIIKNAFERPRRRVLESLVDLVFAGLLTHGCHEIDHRDGNCRYAQRHTIEPSLEFGNDERQSASGTCAGGDNVCSSSASATQVLVNLVQDTLIIGVGVDGI